MTRYNDGSDLYSPSSSFSQHISLIRIRQSIVFIVQLFAQFKESRVGRERKRERERRKGFERKRERKRRRSRGKKDFSVKGNSDVMRCNIGLTLGLLTQDLCTPAGIRV